MRATLNINKLFPRLSIRLKLAIAFTVVALVPIAVVSVLGTRETVSRIESNARGTLQFDLELAEQETAGALRAATSHVEFLTSRVLAPLLLDGRIRAADARDIERITATLIETEPTIYQIKVIDTEGMYRLIMRAPGRPRHAEQADGGQFYSWRAVGIPPGEHVFLPVEVADVDSAGVPTVTRCIAILVPVHDAQGELRGAVVGEAFAAVLFAPLERASAGFQGVTGLVDDRGLFLFHSSMPRGASRPLASQPRIILGDDVSPENNARVVSGEAGSVLTRNGRLVSYRPLTLATGSAPRLSLYRVVPIATLTAPAREFLLTVLLASPLVALAVLGLGMLAADQFTKPILRIREAAWRLARHESLVPPGIDTNDELEDLANDVFEVSRQVDADRRMREELIAERTRLLERTRTELSDLLAHSADGIVLLDGEGIVRVWNGGAEQLTGWTAAEAVGRPVDALLFPPASVSPEGRRARADELERRGAIVNVLMEVPSKVGTPVEVSITQTLLRDTEGRALGSSLILRDNRDRSRLERHMRRSERLAAMSVMAAGLAHEINNPLAIIGNRIECMQRDARKALAPAAVHQDLDVLGEHVERLRVLTTSLLRFAREDDRVAESVSLETLAAGIVALLRQTFAVRGVRLESHVDERVPEIVANAKAIETVLVNLLLNAADATPPGGRVSLAVRPEGPGAIALEVEDTGTGIAPEHRARLFEPFFTTKGANRGTGLGLAVCRSIVDRHGGTIHVGDVPAGGTRFVVILPLNPAGETWMHRAS
ncbi:MAG: ATP-binding protein [Gemmatimonadota bacterium]|nr:ATP-binding protein [Gemmatimonadota bacterium]